LTPLGWALSETSLYFSYVTVSSESFEVDRRPAFAMIIDRAGAGPIPERRFLIAALHAPGDPAAVVVTYSAPPDTFESGLASARDLVARIR
jgi:hypothetical protein